MSSPAETAPLAAVRHIMATAMLGRRETIGSRLGQIVLRPHQRRAAVRLAALVEAYGGGMLAEPVGLGKTYTALAVAAHSGESVLVVAPASLRGMWAEAQKLSGVNAAFMSQEALSRGVFPRSRSGVVIVDESHRLRSPSTRRYALLADLCRTSKVLLLTATPVQNRRDDLAAQLALFLGRPAWEMTDDQLATYVVRHTPIGVGGTPRLDGPHLITLASEDDCLEQLLALTPPVPAKDESIAAALLCYGLVHQWTSSRAALERALQRRRARGLALASAIASGRRPTRAELSAWTHIGDSLQLAFPEMVAEEALDGAIDHDALRFAINRHVSDVEALLLRLRSSGDPDIERAAALRRIRSSHRGERIIAFCHYEETVNVLRSRLSADTGVAALTAQGARVAGGRLSRGDVLRQFTVRVDSFPPERASERIDLLLTTDLLSEGLNLQEASVIIHLDLPWNPARLDQRVGRALRMGSRHEVVTVYVIAPPAAADRLLQIERRLRDKLSAAQRTVGVAHRILPSSLAMPFVERGLAEQATAMDAELIRWIEPGGAFDCRPRSTVVASVEARITGFLALVQTDGGTQLVTDIGAGIDARVGSILSALSQCTGRELEVDTDRWTAARRQLEHWLAARAGESTIDLQAAIAARLRRPALARVAQALARTPRHRRALLAPLADAARAVATAPLSEGAERILETLVRAELPDEAWLRSIATFGQVNARTRTGSRSADAANGVVALILLAKASASL